MEKYKERGGGTDTRCVNAKEVHGKQYQRKGADSIDSVRRLILTVDTLMHSEDRTYTMRSKARYAA
jgi:hypothetical protein